MASDKEPMKCSVLISCDKARARSLQKLGCARAVLACPALHSRLRANV
jgi:hypothetical protein